MRPLARTTLLPLAVAGALALPLAWSSNALLFGPAYERPYDVNWVPQGKALKALSPGLQLSVANYYWLLTVQYLGDPKADERGYGKLYPLVDLVTDLDPRHGYAFQTAGIVLSARGYLEESDRILVKGIEKGPNWWSYPFYLAFNHYFYRGDYAEAARWAEIAARTPGASPNISHLALAMKVKSGDPDDAVRLLEELASAVQDEKTRAALEDQYKLALLQRDFHRLDAAVERYRALRGAPPPRIEALVAEGLLPAVPPEPYGGRYVMGADGRVHSTVRDFRFSPAETWRAKLKPHAPAQVPPTPLAPAPTPKPSGAPK